MSRHSFFSRIAIAAAVAVGLYGAQNPIQAQSGPSLVDQNLQVRVVASGLVQPTTLAFIGANDLLVLEKASGRVMRISQSASPQPVLDLAVNSASERGLLGIALHPNFPATPHVFLYWTESTTLSDSNVLSETPLLGNRVDRYVWNGSSLVFAANLIKIRAIQQDATNGVERGNHDGGVIEVGPDGKLYVFVGDLGRRGQMQNLRCGPAAIFNCPPNTPTPDDQFPDFGPAPDDEHLSGVVLRLNLDGTAPSDNPFFAAGAAIPGEVGANIQKVFSYGHRNSFGMAFPPAAGCGCRRTATTASRSSISSRPA